MPIHNWTSVPASVFYDFHLSWVVELQRNLNQRWARGDFYAQMEDANPPTASRFLPPDHLDEGRDPEPFNESTSDTKTLTLALTQPAVTITDTITEAMLLALHRHRLVIRHAHGDQVIALIEIVPPGIKQGRAALESFVDNAVAAIESCYHLVVLDLFPPGPFDPDGTHGAVWRRLGGTFELPTDKPLTLAAYRAAGAVTCFVEPITVGATLPDMPLFLDPEHYINVPLESTYQRAWEGVPRRWRNVIEKA